MRIHYLTPDLPSPPDQGAKLRNLALIRAAAAHHQVDVLSFASPPTGPPRADEDAADTSALSTQHSALETLSTQHSALETRSTQHSALSECRRVVTVDTPRQRSFARRAWDLWFDQIPDLGHRLESSAFHTALWDLLEHERYDVVQIEGLEMISYLGAVRSAAPRAAVIYDAHNAEMTLQRTMWQTELRDPRRWHAGLYSFFQWSKLGTYERVMMNGTDMVIAVSEPDAARLKGRHVTPELVPNGVDTGTVRFRGDPSPSPSPARRGGPDSRAAEGPGERRDSVSLDAPPPPRAGEGAGGNGPQLLFMGPLAYRPNADAVRWLVGGILPAVRAHMPTARLRLVGRGMERVQANGVDAIGYVDDVADELTSADALVVPMRMGGGVRFKVLEAMAAGVPVVSTPMGLSGVAAEPGQHALVAHSSSEFASALVRIIENPDLAGALTVAARRLVESRYDWSKITPPYLRLLSTARQRMRAVR